MRLDKHKIKELIVKPRIVNSFFLIFNDLFIYLAKAILKVLYAIRMVLFGAGTRTRPFNDFDINVFYKWGKGDIEWMLLGSLSMLALMQIENNRILDIGCGDGWFFSNIYVHKKDVMLYKGIDINEEAISRAKTRTRLLKSSIKSSFCIEDIRRYDSEECYSNVFWYGSMCIFTEEERRDILSKISRVLDDGILCGTFTVAGEGEDVWELFENPYRSTSDLLRDLQSFFAKNRIIQLGKNSWFFASTNNRAIRI